MYVYHVTTEHHAKRIHKEGIHRQSIDGYSLRLEMDKIADTVGQRLYGDKWVNRRDGVYFWETINQAQQNTETNIYDTILTIDPKRLKTAPAVSDVWKLPTAKWENLYSELHTADFQPFNIPENTEIWNKISTIIEQAHPDDGNRDGTHELWAQTPVSADAIIDSNTLSNSPR